MTQTTPDEIEAMRICYEACKGMDEETFDRVYVWLGERLKSEREKEAANERT